MANQNYPTLGRGSSGDSVKELQQALVNAGYDVGKSGVDGIYGSATESAVRKYQQANGLTVDGIAGKNTLGALYGSNNTTANKTETTTEASTPTVSDTQTGGAEAKKFSYDDFSYGDFSYADYAESDTVKQANALLQQQNAAKPGAYQSQWQDEIDSYLNQIQNRDPFSYDFNSDALYQQYKDMYIQQGQMAMMDTMSQAAAMTGGYSNSYAQTVGQQAYNQQLNQLNQIMPDLYQMAFDRYAYEGDQLQNMYNMYLGREEQDYGRYMDSYNAWQNERDYLAGRYDAERDYDYSKWEQERNLAYDQYTADRNLAYDQYSSDRDIAWKEYLTEQENAQSVAELMASAGDYDRLAELYGLSEEEVAAIKAANTPKATGGSGTQQKKYKTFDVGSTEYKTIASEISRATSLDELNNITSAYLALGYDPTQIKAMAAGKISALTPQSEPIDTTVSAGRNAAGTMIQQRQQENRIKDTRMAIY